MAFIQPKDRVLERSTSNSQTVFAVTGAADTSYNAFSASMSVGDTTIGGVVEAGTAFVSGLLTYSAANQITVTTAFESKGTFSAGGTKQVFMGLPGSRALMIDGAQAFTETQKAQARANIYAAPFDAQAYNGMQVNGSCEIDQEAAASAVSFVAGGVSKYTIDGFSVSKSGTNAFSVQQVASVFDGYNKELKLTVTTAQASIGTDFISIDNMIEGYRFARAQWGTGNAQPVSFGFNVKSSVSGAMRVDIISASNDIVSTTVNIAAANTAQFVTGTFPATTTGTWNKANGLGARFRVYPAISGSINIVATNANTFEMTGLIILPGIELPAAARAPFIMRPFDQEIQACQRFYEKSFDYATAPAQNVGPNGAAICGQIAGASTSQSLTSFRFSARKRSVPSMIGYSPNNASNQIFCNATGTNWSSTAFQSVGEGGFGLTGTSPAGSGAGQTSLLHWTADSRL